MNMVRLFACLCLLPASALLAVDLAAAPRKVLFFDLWKLDYWDNVELKQGEPKWVEEGTYSDPAFPDR